jgi:hypothetical protein
LAPLPSLAKDFDFKQAVEDMEDHLGSQRVRIPMWGLMRFVGYPIYRPMGVKDFDMAIFDNARRLRGEHPRVFERLGAGWRPMLRVKHRDRDSVYIYARDEGSWVRMLMLTADGGDAVLMQFKMRPSRLMLFLSQHAQRR